MGVKSEILLSKKTTKKGKGVKNRQFCEDIVYGRPLGINFKNLSIRKGYIYNVCQEEAKAL